MPDDVEPQMLDAVLAIAERWEIRATVIGIVTDTGMLRVLDREGGDVIADIPAKSLEDEARQRRTVERFLAELEAGLVVAFVGAPVLIALVRGRRLAEL